MGTLGDATLGAGTLGDALADVVEAIVGAIHVREKPPLRMHIDIQTPSGRHYRWGADEPDPANVPTGLRFSDTMPGGFETCDCTLPRKPGVDYADLERLSDMRVVGVGGEVCWEGRLERAPRTSGDEVSVSPSAVGWQAHLDDDKSAVMVFVDRGLSGWGDMSLAEKSRVSNLSRDISSLSFSTGGGGVEGKGLFAAFPNQALGAEVWAASWYAAPAGVLIESIGYQGADRSLPAGWESPRFLSADDAASGGEIATLATFDDTLRQVVPATAKRYVSVRVYSNGTAATPAAGAFRRVEKLAVYGDHGLPQRAISGEPGGFLAFDVVSFVVQTWAPLLQVKPDSIQQSSFVIPHLVFLEPTTAAEIVRQASRFDLPDWAVWDDKEFVWHQPGARGRTWRLRIGPSQLEETGPQIDRLWESVIVQYQDVDSTARTVGPLGSGADTESSDLKDSDPDNPANKLGITRRDLLQMGTSTAAGATEVGRRFLEQSKLLDRSGKARVVGWAEDDRGVVHPFSAIRSGDYAVFVDASDTSPRKVIRTDKDYDSRTCSLDLDAPPQGLEQLLERLGVVLVPLGIS